MDLVIEGIFPTSDEVIYEPLDLTAASAFPLFTETLPAVTIPESPYLAEHNLGLEQSACSCGTCASRILFLEHMVKYFTHMNNYHHKSWLSFTHRFSVTTLPAKLRKLQRDFVDFTTNFGPHYREHFCTSRWDDFYD